LIHLEQAIIVEGKYDKIKLASIIDAIIIPTNGFSIFKDKEKCELIRHYAINKGIIILTDSDTAGFKIRNYIKGFVKNGNIKNVYIPDVFGKEKRKNQPSKEGKIGVEGIKADLIIDIFNKSGIICSDVIKKDESQIITKMDLYDDGFIGGNNSSKMRKILLKQLGLPELLTTGSMLDVLNTMFDKNEYKKIVASLELSYKKESE